MCAKKNLRRPLTLVIWQTQKIVEFFLCLLVTVPVTFLQLAQEFLQISLDLVNVVIAHSPPPASDVAPAMQPFAFKNFLVHRFPFDEVLVETKGALAMPIA
jgi:hypothetical protein